MLFVTNVCVDSELKKWNFKYTDTLKKTLPLIIFLYFALINAFTQDFSFPVDEFSCSEAKLSSYSFTGNKKADQSHLLDDYDVTFYFLDLAAENDTLYISGNVTINATVMVSELDTFAIELVQQLSIDSVLINGNKLNSVHINDEVFVPLDLTLPLGSILTAKIYYHGTPPSKGFETGIYSNYDTIWNKHVTWTLSEPFNAKTWWPTKQDLTDKADSAWVFITTSASNKAGSEGILTATVPLPGNKVRYEWKTKYPIDYYLISFAVSEFQDYSIYAHPDQMAPDSLLIQNYIYDSPGCLEYYKNDISNTTDLISLFSDLFSVYPFKNEKYGHCLTTIHGGMEHQTMTTLGNFGFELVAHELGHMWFGDNVTCASWGDIWLNEGFATYADYLGMEKIAGGNWPHLWLQIYQDKVLSIPDGSVYVPLEDVVNENADRIFDSRLSYLKGAMLLHMIRYEIQDDTVFFNVLKNYQAAFTGGTTSVSDFIGVLNQTSGMDFNEFFDQWYYGQGYPVYAISWSQSGTGFELHSSQTSSAPDITPFFKMHIPIKVFFNNGSDTMLRIPQIQPDMTFDYPFINEIDSIEVDPELWVLKKVAGINGIANNETEKTIRIYPNPVFDQLNIRTDDNQNCKLTVFDMYGKITKQVILSQTLNRIYVGDLPKGFYLAKLILHEKTFSFKFVKN